MSDLRTIDTIADLESLYGTPPEGSLLKEIDRLTPEYTRWLTSSPFFGLATIGPEGMDCSPRGDAGQGAFVVDERTLHIPDRRGNNRLDSLRNIVRDGRVALLFLIPGVRECLRINGRAALTDDDALRRSYAVEDKLPATVIVVTIESVYSQCARAVTRSGLWDSTTWIDPSTVPTAGQMTKGARAPDFDAEAYDGALRERQARTLW